MKIGRLTVRLATACAIIITLLAASAGVSARNSKPDAPHAAAGSPPRYSRRGSKLAFCRFCSVNGHLDAPILLPTEGGLIGRDGRTVAHSRCRKSVPRDTLPDQIRHDRIGATLGPSLIVAIGTRVIRIARDGGGAVRIPVEEDDEPVQIAGGAVLE